jgi:hypothetical protein
MSLEVDLIEAEREFKEKYIDTHTLPPDFKTMKESGEIRAASMKEALLIQALKNAYLKIQPFQKEFDEAKEKLIAMIAEAPGIESSIYGKITHKFSKGSISWKEAAQRCFISLGLDEKAIEKVKKACTGKGSRKFNYPYKMWKKNA